MLDEGAVVCGYEIMEPRSVPAGSAKTYKARSPERDFRHAEISFDGIGRRPATYERFLREFNKSAKNYHIRRFRALFSINGKQDRTMPGAGYYRREILRKLLPGWRAHSSLEQSLDFITSWRK